jgi:hypothetical protein
MCDVYRVLSYFKCLLMRKNLNEKRGPTLLLSFRAHSKLDTQNTQLKTSVHSLA